MPTRGPQGHGRAPLRSLVRPPRSHSLSRGPGPVRVLGGGARPSPCDGAQRPGPPRLLLSSPCSGAAVEPHSAPGAGRAPAACCGEAAELVPQSLTGVPGGLARAPHGTRGAGACQPAAWTWRAASVPVSGRCGPASSPTPGDRGWGRGRVGRRGAEGALCRDLSAPSRPGGCCPGASAERGRGPVRAPPPAGHTGGWRTWRGASGLGRCHLRSPLLSDCVSGSHSVAGPWLSQVYLE